MIVLQRQPSTQSHRPTQSFRSTFRQFPHCLMRVGDPRTIGLIHLHEQPESWVCHLEPVHVQPSDRIHLITNTLASLAREACNIVLTSRQNHGDDSDEATTANVLRVDVRTGRIGETRNADAAVDADLDGGHLGKFKVHLWHVQGQSTDPADKLGAHVIDEYGRNRG
jgi:hypothetical protein